MSSKILPDFQEFLISRALVDKKHIPLYARWVSKFLAFSHQNKNFGLQNKKKKKRKGSSGRRERGQVVN